MTVTLTKLSDLVSLGFDQIIDVRSPSEFAEDHLPDAINLPVMSDDERAEIGTLYKQVSPFKARKLGAAYVARNAAAHLQGPLAERDGGWKPLVYCWRGGQRSGAFEVILAQIGWRVGRIEGGYKAWRSLVVEAVHQRPIAPPVILLDGNTGTAKTEILQLLAARGQQVIDLEGLAHHRGSLFGALGAQPSQKMFERDLALALEGLDPAKPLLLEAESAKIGNLRLPGPLWAAICAAPRIALQAPIAARAHYLARAYSDLGQDRARLIATIEHLRPYHSAERIAFWQALAGAGDLTALAAQLVEFHYDPRYRSHRARRPLQAYPLVLEDLDHLEAAADQVMRLIADLPLGRQTGS